jgi:hypothetical protein
VEVQPPGPARGQKQIRASNEREGINHKHVGSTSVGLRSRQLGSLGLASDHSADPAGRRPR